MRLLRHSIRFIVVVCSFVVVAGPAAAGTMPDGYLASSSRQPTNHSTQSAAWQMGTLRIPAIGVEEPVRVGVDPSVLNMGVGYWSGTAQPGQQGNVVLGGHRTTWTHPFADLDDLREGDLVTMTDGRGIEIMYRVTETMIVEPRDMWIANDTATPSLTLFACHPKGSARYRIVVVAELVSAQPRL